MSYRACMDRLIQLHELDVSLYGTLTGFNRIGALLSPGVARGYGTQAFQA